MRYEDIIKKIADSDKTVFDRGDLCIREMCRLINDIVDYRYAAEHYNGDSMDSVLRDKTNSIKNSLGVLESEFDIYKEMLGITTLVNQKKVSRINKIADRI